MKVLLCRVYVSVCGHVGENICLTAVLFEGLSVHPFVCSYTVLCMFLSVRLSTRTNITVGVSVRPCVRQPACMDIVCYSISLYAFFPSVRPSERPSVLLSSVRMIMHACKSVVYKHVRDIPFFKL